MGNMYYLSTYLYISEHNNPRVGWGSSLYLCMLGKGGGLGADWNYSLSLSLSLCLSLSLSSFSCCGTQGLECVLCGNECVYVPYLV